MYPNIVYLVHTEHSLLKDSFVCLFVLITIFHRFFFLLFIYISISLIVLTNNYIGILNLGGDLVTNVIFGGAYMKDYTS